MQDYGGELRTVKMKGLLSMSVLTLMIVLQPVALLSAQETSSFESMETARRANFERIGAMEGVFESKTEAYNSATGTYRPIEDYYGKFYRKGYKSRLDIYGVKQVYGQGPDSAEREATYSDIEEARITTQEGSVRWDVKHKVATINPYEESLYIPEVLSHLPGFYMVGPEVLPDGDTKESWLAKERGGTRDYSFVSVEGKEYLLEEKRSQHPTINNGVMVQRAWLDMTNHGYPAFHKMYIAFEDREYLVNEGEYVYQTVNGISVLAEFRAHIMASAATKFPTKESEFSKMIPHIRLSRRYRDISLPDVLPDDVFEPQFPSDVLIYDNIAGVRIGRDRNDWGVAAGDLVSDDDLDTLVKATEKLAGLNSLNAQPAPIEAPPQAVGLANDRRSWAWLILSAGGMTLFVGGLATVIRRRRT